MPTHRQVLRHATVIAFALAISNGATADDTHAFVPAITGEDFAAHIKVLASDEFGGRRPGTEGEQKTLQYLSGMFKAMGLAPGNGDSYFQKVPVQVRLADWPHSKASVTVGGKNMALSFGPQVVLGSDNGQAEANVSDSPMIFVGYGIDAPEQDWNDYAGVDVHGKTVVILAGEPVGESGGRELFEGRRLTHYSRYGYKVEEAARQGAVAAIIVHDTDGVGYDWKAVNAKWHHTEFALRAADRTDPIVAVEGWIAGDSAKALFAAAGMNLAQLRGAAGHGGFKSQAVGDAKFSAALKGKIVLGESNNVIARLTGTTHPDEAVIYCAHWDHLGTQAQEKGDNIYNGAIDNASGVATVLEIAGKFASQPKPERTILFLIPTLEEFGLLGSKYYTLHPVIPLANTVAEINFDMVVPIGRARDFVVVGLDYYSDIDRILKPIANHHGRVLTAERPADKDSFFRSDHLNFAKSGVPVLYMRGGMQTAGGLSGEDSSDATWNRIAAVYHTPKDQFDPDWDLRGIADDIEISYDVGAQLAGSRDWPNYRPGSPYRRVRDASRKASGSN
jgi:Zn-dependent M28 family amino/carboxypeptidase